MAVQTPILSQARAEVARACRSLATDGLVRGTSGNVSIRDGDRIAASSTGAVLATLEAEAVVVTDRTGALLDGDRDPTSEIGMHLAVYDRHDWAGAVVHTHAPVATALSCVLDELPVVHYEMLALGGPVRVARYETFGTPELAAAAIEALEGRTVALLANHGTLSTGPDVDAAIRATELLEWLCEVYWRASAVGTPRALDTAQQEHFRSEAARRQYGR